MVYIVETGLSGKGGKMTLNFERAYNEYSGLVYRIGVLYFRDASAAEDIVHDCFVKLFTKRPRITDEGHLKGWLITVARNLCHTSAKKNRIYVPLDENIPAKQDTDNTLLDAVMKLPELDRTTVYLHYYEGYSSKEIASFLFVSDDAVRGRLKRARAALKTILEE